MSQENVEIVRRHINAYLTGDFETALSVYSHEVECDATARPEGQTYRGHDGVVEAFRVWRGTWDSWRGEIERIVDSGDRVLMVLHETGRGKGSGVEVEQLTYFVHTLRDGLIVHAVILVDEASALDAARLSE